MISGDELVYRMHEYAFDFTESYIKHNISTLRKKDPLETMKFGRALEKELLARLRSEGITDAQQISRYLAHAFLSGTMKFEREAIPALDKDELVYKVIDSVQTSLDAYIAQNEAVTKKLFDKVRELEDRISYLETRGE